MAVTPAHKQEVTIRLIVRWPAHEPRTSDPNYKYFHQAKARMKKAGLLKCAVESDYHSTGPIELHHSLVEYAHANQIDVKKFNHAYGLHLDDESFKRYIEEEGNLEPLCTLHHRGQEGIHSLDTPTWNVLRTSKNPKEVVIAVANNEIPVDTKGVPSAADLAVAPPSGFGI